MAVKMEHVLILLIAVFLLYHFVGRCRCNGFSVGSEQRIKHSKRGQEEPADDWVDTITKDMGDVVGDIENAIRIENLIEKKVAEKVAEEIKNWFSTSSESRPTSHRRGENVLR